MVWLTQRVQDAQAFAEWPGYRPGRRLEQLSTLGIAPDAVLRLLQKRPAPVVQVGETEVAIDFDIARQIYVKPPN